IFLSVLSPVGASLGTVSTERVNLQDQTGAQATGGRSGDPAINDARFPVEDPEILIAFVSSATNLVSPDTNSVQDIFLTGAIPQPTGSHFRRGDANSDASINVSDPIFVLAYLFEGGTPPPCEDAADVDDDGVVEVNDPIYLLGWLFQGTGLPPKWPT